MAEHDVTRELRDPHGKWTKGGALLERMAREAAGASKAHSVGDKVVYKDNRGKDHSATVKRVYSVRRSPEPHHYTLKLDKPTGRYGETTREAPHSRVRKA